jgi:hypothetical protein
MKDRGNNMVSLVGYGTFITKGLYAEGRNIEVCFVPKHRRIYPITWSGGYPFALPDLNCAGFFALKFEIDNDQLSEFDWYEGVPQGLYDRVEIPIIIRKNKQIQAFIYLISQQSLKEYKIALESDTHDRWLEEIKACSDKCHEFPELLWDPKKLPDFK